MAIGRVIRPEILDGLPPADPEARRSRRDLRWINCLQGNPAWLRARLADSHKIVELGAGDGVLARQIAVWFPEAELTGLDLAPRPAGLPERMGWKQGDLFETLPASPCDTVIGAMIVHHFSDAALARLGAAVVACGARRLCLCEPWRSGLSHFWGGLLSPFTGRVTQHDMPASIDAGFVPGELPGRLNLPGWRVRESVHWRGVLRLQAWKE